MSLDGFSKKGMELGNDPEGIKEGPFFESQYDSGEDIDDYKHTMYRNLLSSGADSVVAYQIAYGVSYEEAEVIVSKQTYFNLIHCGVSEEDARKIAFRKRGNNSNKNL